MTTKTNLYTKKYFQSQCGAFMDALGTRGTKRSAVKNALGGLLHLSVETPDTGHLFRMCAREFAARDMLMTAHGMWPKEVTDD